MDSVVPLPIEPKTLQELTEKTKDYALMHGTVQTFEFRVAAPRQENSFFPNFFYLPPVVAASSSQTKI